MNFNHSADLKRKSKGRDSVPSFSDLITVVPVFIEVTMVVPGSYAAGRITVVPVSYPPLVLLPTLVLLLAAALFDAPPRSTVVPVS